MRWQKVGGGVTEWQTAEGLPLFTAKSEQLKINWNKPQSWLSSILFKKLQIISFRLCYTHQAEANKRHLYLLLLTEYK